MNVSVNKVWINQALNIKSSMLKASIKYAFINVSIKKIIHLSFFIIIVSFLLACSEKEKSDKIQKDLEQINPVTNTTIPGALITTPTTIPELNNEGDNENLNPGGTSSGNLNEEIGPSVSDQIIGGDGSIPTGTLPEIPLPIVNSTTTTTSTSTTTTTLPLSDSGGGGSTSTSTTTTTVPNNSGNDSNNDDSGNVSEHIDFHFDQTTGKCKNNEGQIGYNLNYLGECGYIKNQILANKNIENINAKGIRFYNVILYNIQFDTVDFTNAVFERSLLKNVSFNNCILFDAKFKKSIFKNIEFYNSEFGNSKFNKIHHSRVSIYYRNLWEEYLD